MLFVFASLGDTLPQIIIVRRGKETKQIIDELGKKIRSLREAKGIMQKDCARDINIEPSALGRIERGETNPTVKTLCLIAEYFEVDIQSLFSEIS